MIKYVEHLKLSPPTAHIVCLQHIFIYLCSVSLCIYLKKLSINTVSGQLEVSFTFELDDIIGWCDKVMFNNSQILSHFISKITVS